jgi:hypothetical protein
LGGVNRRVIRFLRVHDAILSVDRQRVEQVQAIFRQRFGAAADHADKIPDLLNQRFVRRQRSPDGQ